MKHLLIALASAMSFSAHSDDNIPIKYVCFQLPTLINQTFESGLLSCNSDGKPQRNERKKVCSETAFCLVDNPDLEDSFKSAGYTGGENALAKSQYLALNYQKMGVNPHTSFLLCNTEDNGDCPHPSRCQQDLLYNLKSNSTPDAFGATYFRGAKPARATN